MKKPGIIFPQLNGEMNLIGQSQSECFEEPIYSQESYKIMGACFEVYREMGCGFLEDVYQQCLSIELTSRNIPFIEKPKLEIFYKNQLLNKSYEPDFLCFNAIVLELKAHTLLNEIHRAQVLNYLRSTNLSLGLLINFGHHPKLQYERLVL